MFKKLQTAFKQLGATMVVEMSCFTAVALELAYQEFKSKYVAVNGHKIENYIATKGTNCEEEEKKEPMAAVAGQKFYKKEHQMPIIASECPGWVCYAEKRVGDLALPFMSKTKSPQQLCGILSKLYLAKKSKLELEDESVSEVD